MSKFKTSKFQNFAFLLETFIKCLNDTQIVVLATANAKTIQYVRKVQDSEMFNISPQKFDEIKI